MTTDKQEKRSRGRPRGTTPPKTATERSKERRERLAAMRSAASTSAEQTPPIDENNADHVQQLKALRARLEKGGAKLTPLLLQPDAWQGLNLLAKECNRPVGYVLAKVAEELFDLVYLYAIAAPEERASFALHDKRLWHIHWVMSNIDRPKVFAAEKLKGGGE